MKGLLLDTHVWYWYLTGSTRLPTGLRRAIDGAVSDCWLSPISVWELGLVVRRGRVEIDRPFREWVEEALRRFPLSDAPLVREIALLATEIELPRRDPADRFLAATALVHELTLATLDERLVRAKWLRTRSR